MKLGKRNLPVMSSIIPSNEAFIQRLHDKIVSLNKKKICFVGITFKNYSDDLRESPIFKIVNNLNEDAEYTINIVDEDLNSETIRVDYPHLFSKISSLENGIANADLLVVSKRYLNAVLEKRPAGRQVLNYSDTQGITGENVLNLYN
jgi:GDP-mannose 6-dehydrogenase